MGMHRLGPVQPRESVHLDVLSCVSVRTWVCAAMTVLPLAHILLSMGYTRLGGVRPLVHAPRQQGTWSSVHALRCASELQVLDRHERVGHVRS